MYEYASGAVGWKGMWEFRIPSEIERTSVYVCILSPYLHIQYTVTVKINSGIFHIWINISYDCQWQRHGIIYMIIFDILLWLPTKHEEKGRGIFPLHTHPHLRIIIAWHHCKDHSHIKQKRRVWNCGKKKLIFI